MRSDDSDLAGKKGRVPEICHSYCVTGRAIFEDEYVFWFDVPMNNA